MIAAGWANAPAANSLPKQPPLQHRDPRPRRPRADRLALSSSGITSLLCVERDPEACHRSLIAQQLTEQHGVAIEHLARRKARIHRTCSEAPLAVAQAERELSR